MDEFLDKLAKFVVIQIVLLIAGFITLIVTVAFFGDFIAANIMNKLPW